MDTTANDRLVLPVADPPPPRTTHYDAKDPAARFEPLQPLRPPAGAPNVVVILLDDLGFGVSSAFGGPVRTPTAERLAGNGLRYTRFHTTALCAPTRASLLTGRNHHSVGMGAVTELATAAPGYSSVRPKSAAPLAEVLRLNGYSTAQFGKCHEVPVWESSPVGPFDAWPTGGGGMEHFYGFIGGETNQYYPSLFQGTTPVEVDKTPEEGYHLTEDLADHAIGWLRQQRALAPDRPFFLYFAPGAAHAPHHVPPGWAERYAGEFDDGWDALRERTFARQKALGVIPEDAELTARPDEIPAWEDMPTELKPVLARQMEVFAGFLEHTDHHVGRLVDALDEVGALEDTLVYYIVGDNGASGEGTVNGSFNEGFVFNGVGHLETPEFLSSKIDEFGSPTAYNHYSVGWAHATGTPYQWTKQIASHWGGTRNGTIVHWPAGITGPTGSTRSQFTHVIDIAPTVLEVAGIPAPREVHGVQQMPLHGTSMAYSFDDPDALERHDLQYFECFVNRGVYHQGWTAVTRHSTPWVVEPLPPLDEDVWELYAPEDWTQANNLAAEMPEKLAELQRLFLIEAVRYQVLPLDDRRIERFSPELAGRPMLLAGNSQRLYPGMGRLPENCVLNLKNKSFAITARLTVPDGVRGVVVAQGGAFGGWSLYTHEGRAAFCYNLLGLQRIKVYGAQPLTPGPHELRLEFAYDGGGLGKGGQLTLAVDGSPVGTARMQNTVPMIFSPDETTDLGEDLASPVSDDYTAGETRFTGTIEWVQIDLGEDALDHQVSPEERMRVALARQ